MKTYTQAEVEDKLIGKKGTPIRDKYEYDLQMELIGISIKNARKERNLTQEQLGEMIGVQKAQISRLESNAGNVTIETLIRVFSALKAKVTFQIELPKSVVKYKNPTEKLVRYKISSKINSGQISTSVSEPEVEYKKKILHKESNKISKNSIDILREFEKLMDKEGETD